VINPSNGHGSYQDSNFVSGIQQLESAGIMVIGYISTGYGTVPISQVEQEISAYSQLYKVNGVFFDEMSNVPGARYENYYSTLTSFSSSVGMSITIGNPGASIPASYIGTIDNIVVYENSGLPPASFLSGLGYNKGDFSIMSYGVSFDSGFVQSASSDVGYLYLTNGTYPSPYVNLPSYFSLLMETLAGMDSSGPVPISSDPTVTVESFDLSGSQIAGLYLTVYSSSGQVVASGFTPFSLQASSSSSYTIIMDNFGSYTFDYWGSGSSAPSTTVTPTSNLELAAYYYTQN
jgi:Spherulation-specific family 4